MKTILTLHTFAPPSSELLEVHRLEPRGKHNFVTDPIPVMFDGQIYAPVPPHLATPGYSATEPGKVLIPYMISMIYDVDFDDVAERLYTPTEADELVERVRFPLERVVKGARRQLQGTEDREFLAELAASEKLLRELEGPTKYAGPERCTHVCAECNGLKPPLDELTPRTLEEFVKQHHFSEVLTSDVDEHPEHEAARLGWEAWFTCKHCPAWTAALPVP